MLSESTTWYCRKQYLYSQNDVNIDYLINDNYRTLWKGRMRRNGVIYPAKSSLISQYILICQYIITKTDESRNTEVTGSEKGRDSSSFIINSIFFLFQWYVLFGYKMKMHYTSIYRYNLRQLVKCSMVEETSLSVLYFSIETERKSILYLWIISI